MRNKDISFYHRAYEAAQPLGLVGRWSLAVAEHLRAIKENFPNGAKIDGLYCGTATSVNPLDAKVAVTRAGYDCSFTTLDLSERPLKNLSPANRPVMADAIRLPFLAESFNLITTDFLFNMMPLELVIEIIAEWARVLHEDGVISTSVFTDDGQPGSWYKAILKNLAAKHFFNQEVLRVAFSANGLDLTSTDSFLANRPLLYHQKKYTHLVAVKSQDLEEQKKARELVTLSMKIAATVNSEATMAKTDVNEVLTDLVSGKYVLKLNDEGELIGWMKMINYSNNWSELSSIWVDEEHRNKGIASVLVKEMLTTNNQQNWWAATQNPAAAAVLEHLGFEKKNTLDLPIKLLIEILGDRGQVPGRILQAAKRNNRSIWVKMNS